MHSGDCDANATFLEQCAVIVVQMTLFIEQSLQALLMCHSAMQRHIVQCAAAIQSAFGPVLQVLTGSHMAKVLLMVHQQLALARHPSHLLRSLGPLRAALQLLGERIRVPLTFRYVVHILLWLLKARYS